MIVLRLIVCFIVGFTIGRIVRYYVERNRDRKFERQYCTGSRWYSIFCGNKYLVEIVSNTIRNGKIYITYRYLTTKMYSFDKNSYIGDKHKMIFTIPLYGGNGFAYYFDTKYVE